MLQICFVIQWLGDLQKIEYENEYMELHINVAGNLRSSGM